MGHTPTARNTALGGSVHPHIRGAYFHVCGAAPTIGGSSPHTWGIRYRERLAVDMIRFIPTYVGHTATFPGRGPLRSGSSPHTWGILIYVGKHRPATRFIPTYVGHTGEAQQLLPRSWFIPTYVGHTPRTPTWGLLGPVHPHIRGAYQITQIRGFGLVRFIPTYVGHTWMSMTLTPSSSVHPHIRGAYASTALQCAAYKRFIPTYVGHTLDRRKKNGWFQPLFLKFYTKKLFCARSSVFRCYRGRSIPKP